jgi:hypothetical protein
MSTEHPFEERNKQYKFIKNDLEKTSKNQDIDWIRVHQHKPFYSTHVDREEGQRNYVILFYHYLKSMA